MRRNARVFSADARGVDAQHSGIGGGRLARRTLRRRRRRRRARIHRGLAPAPGSAPKKRSPRAAFAEEEAAGFRRGDGGGADFAALVGDFVLGGRRGGVSRPVARRADADAGHTLGRRRGRPRVSVGVGGLARRRRARGGSRAGGGRGRARGRGARRRGSRPAAADAACFSSPRRRRRRRRRRTRGGHGAGRWGRC